MSRVMSQPRTKPARLSRSRERGVRGHSPFFVSLSRIMKEPIFVSGSWSSSSALSLPSPSNSQLGSRREA